MAVEKGLERGFLFCQFPLLNILFNIIKNGCIFILLPKPQTCRVCIVFFCNLNPNVTMLCCHFMCKNHHFRSGIFFLNISFQLNYKFLLNISKYVILPLCVNSTVYLLKSPTTTLFWSEFRIKFAHLFLARVYARILARTRYYYVHYKSKISLLT